MATPAGPGFDVIVVGGGTMGSGVALALTRRGKRVLVLEQFTSPSDLASHSGKTRIIRQAYFEGPDYVPMVQRADAMWCAIGDEVGQTLLHRCGGLDISSPGTTQAEGARLSSERWNVPHEWLDGAEIRHRWPQFRTPDDWVACYSPVTGYLDVEPSLRAMRTLAERLGAVWHEHEAVSAWEATAQGVRVSTAAGTYDADRLILTAGAWTTELLRDLGLPIVVRRKVLWWYAMDDPAMFHAERFPVFLADTPACHLYGIPMAAGDPGLKVGDHAGGQETLASELNREVDMAEADHVTEAMHLLLNGVMGRITDAKVCMYAMTPDEDFIVDRHPDYAHVVFAGGFSGHGFKFAPAMGEHLADLSLDATVEALPHISLGRFAVRAT